MAKPVSRLVHGFVDYNYVAAVTAAPQLVGFTQEKSASLLCGILSGTVLASTLLTRAEWGIVRVMPFKIHLAIDALGSALALGAPWLFGFSQNARARNTFLVIGLSGIIVGLLTQPEEMPTQPQ